MGHRPTHPEPGMVHCCPRCESACYQGRMLRQPKFRCDDCGHEFDRLGERQARIRRPGIVRTLDRSDPEDLGLSPIGDRA